MRAGDAFVLKDKEVDDHLWVVLSDPAANPEKVLIVSITTLAAHKEQVCLIQGGEHPFVRHLSCAAYDFARLVSDDQLNQLRHGGRFDMQAPVSAELLARIRQGVAESTRIAMECADLLIDQGLLEC